MEDRYTLPRHHKFHNMPCPCWRDACSLKSFGILPRDRLARRYEVASINVCTIRHINANLEQDKT